MYDPNDVFDQMAHHESHLAEFAKPVIATGIGMFAGHMLSKTRFGQWFENSSVVGWLIGLILIAIGIYVLYCAVCFVWIFGAAILAG